MAAITEQVHCFGLKADVRDNICYVDEQTVVYPAGATLVVYNTDTRTQHFIPGSDGAVFTAMAVSPNRRYIALAERGATPSVSIYDLHTLKKRKVLSTRDTNANEYVCLCFSPDSKYLVSLGGGPDWMLSYWAWEKSRGAMSAVRVSMQPEVATYQVTFNPQDNTQLCVVGQGIFKLLRYTEGALKPVLFQKFDSTQDYLCHAWLSSDRMIAGTKSGLVVLFEHGELRAEWTVTTDAGQGVKTLNVFSRGFVIGTGHHIVVFEKTDDASLYRRGLTELLPSTASIAQRINSMTISPNNTHLLCTTHISQIFSLPLSDPESEEGAGHNAAVVPGASGGNITTVASDDAAHTPHQRAVLLSQGFHHGQINGLDVCTRKPVVATVGMDRSVRVWNFAENTLENIKYFSDEALSVALHPSGFHLVVGFVDKVRFLNVLIDDIRVVKEFPLRGCVEVRFSTGGHLFAVAQSNVVSIFSTYTFELAGQLKGHTGRIACIRWDRDDKTIVTCGKDGAVYQWDAQTHQRIGENVLKTCEYAGLSCSPDASTVYVVGSDKTLKEIKNHVIVTTVPSQNKSSAADVHLTQVLTGQLTGMLFTATADGAIQSLKTPLTPAWEGTVYTTHCGPIGHLALEPREHFLFSAGADGCLFVHKAYIIKSNEVAEGLPPTAIATGAVVSMGSHTSVPGVMQYAEEILITKTDLEEKNQIMAELHTRVEELKMANEYQLRIKDMNYNEKIKDVSSKFVQEIESLKAQLLQVKTEKDKQETRHAEEVSELMKQSQSEVDEIHLQHNQKLVGEYQNFQDLQQRSKDLQAQYEQRLESLEQARREALATLEQTWQARLSDKDAQLLAAEQTSTQQRREYEEIRRQTEDDTDREILALKNRYERQLKDEQEAGLKLKGENGVLRKKFKSLQNDTDEHKKRRDEMESEQQRLHAHIKALEKDILSGKKEIEERDETIQQKERRIHDLKKKNQELEKFKFVLDYKIKELRKQIEPREQEIKENTAQIGQMDEELAKYHQTNSDLELQLASVNDKLHAARQDLGHERKMVAEYKNQVSRFRSDVEAAAQCIQKPKELTDRVRKLYKTHCLAATSGATAVKGPENQSRTAEEEVQQEHNRQRDFLERTVESLRKKLAKSELLHKEESSRVMQENVVLIKEINDLRQELKASQKQGHNLEATLRTTRNLQRMRGQSNSSMPLDLSSLLPSAQQEQQLERVIEMQKAEIRRLRETINTLERQSDAPSGKSRLPSLDLETTPSASSITA